MRIVTGPAKLGTHEHATLQLARPLATLNLKTKIAPPQLFPSESDHAAAALLLPRDGAQLIAIHPGSGSATKNWPMAKWIALAERLLGERRRLVVIGGEADEAQLGELRRAWTAPPIYHVINQPLPVVAAVLARCDAFIGHDSGISHIAAAVGTKSIVLFGATDPAVWAPRNRNARIVRAASGLLAGISVDDVFAALATS
jgi:heptosyltransferase-2